MALQEELELQGNKLFKYRGTLPLILLFSSIGVFAYLQLHGMSFAKYISYDNYELICLGVSLFGLLIRILTVGFTPKNTSGRNTEGQLADELNTTGIYSTVRHPLYVGNFFMWLGSAMLVQNIWFTIIFILVYWVYYERIMFAEEQFLRKKFGETYVSWSMYTPAFIMSFKNYIKPKYPFSWKKVIKKEKNGVAAIFVILLLFRVLSQYLNGEPINTHHWMFYATGISVVGYFILKLLKKYTRVFDEEGR